MQFTLKKKSFYFFLFLLLISFGNSVAQVYTISNTTVNTCSGNFFDTGGNNGNYNNNQNITMTICAGTAGSCVRLTFTSFNLENNYDFLRIYNGPSTAFPLIGTYTGNNNPGVITSTTGCLTIRFTSDNIISAAGWAAQISCVPCAVGTCQTTCNGGPPPANDACANAQNLGAIPIPPACPTGGTTNVTVNTTNLCATAPTPYSSLLGCQPANANMASPAADVWYSFTITAPTLNILINGGLATPNIGLYQGNACNALTPRGCAIGNNGVLNATFSGLGAGTYYLQVSGGNMLDQCNFTLSVRNSYDCNDCVFQSTLNVNPQPVNGFYSPGQQITFCYTITNYNQASINWLHGVVPTFGPGWNPATLTPVSATNISGAGAWNWYTTNVTSSATGSVNGPGYYYESPLGSPNGVMDGNPGNNFGDNNPNNLPWTFCWRISTDPGVNCVQGASLNMSINTLGDGESGSWQSLACTQDPLINFFSAIDCCDPPIVNVTSPVCAGVNNGSATTIGQVPGPWNYVWMTAAGVVISQQNGINGPSTVNNLAPGNYMVRVTDNNGCIATTNFSVNNPLPFTAAITTTPALCNGVSNGTASVTVNGGTPGFTYNWSPALASGSTPANLPAGNYTVTVTDANGCTTVAQGVVAQPTPVTLTSSNVVNVSCTGGNNGSITIAAAGGTPPYNYIWSNGATGTTANNLGPGTYTATVTDNRGCTATVQVTITQPPPVTVNLTSTAAACGGSTGTATATAGGGTPGYTYQWQPSGGTGATANNLANGNYTVTVTDSRGCTATGTVAVAVTPPPVITLNTTTAVNCNGGSNGSATVNATGGTAPLTITWSNGASGTTANNLPAGTYTATVTDANGCTATVQANITEPTPVTVNLTTTAATCGGSNGTATATAGGGTPPYNYTWSNGTTGTTANNLANGNYTVTVTDDNGCTATATITVASSFAPVIILDNATAVNCNGGSDGSSTVNATGGTAPLTITWSNGATGATANNLSAGTYTATVTDANGCTAQITVNINEPAALQLTPNTTSASCGASNGSAGVVVAGGTGPYQYAWLPTAGTGATLNNIPAGTYAVTVTDANGCTEDAQINVVDNPAPVITDAVTGVSCNGGSDGSVILTVTQGSGPYNYLWSNGATGGTLNSLPAGTYTATVTDANGCTAQITVNVNEPAALQLTPNATGASCGATNGSAGVVVAGGTGPYQYDWLPAVGTGATVNNLPAGSYSVTVTDAYGCTTDAVIPITSTNGPNLAIVSTTNASCAGIDDGSINLAVNGGALPYAILWSSVGSGLASTNLSAGTYTITVTDAANCTSAATVIINEPPPIVLNAAPVIAHCGQSDGNISVQVTGGQPAYTYLWSNGTTGSAVLNNIPAGPYTLVVTDQNGCTGDVQVTVTDSPGPAITVVVTADVTCNSGNDGAATVNVTQGTGPFAYLWSNGTIGNSATGLSVGIYTITVTDPYGCTATGNATITEPASLNVQMTTTDAVCGSANGTAQATVTGGTAPYDFLWAGGGTTPSLNGLAAGAYALMVTDAAGCTVQAVAGVANAGGPALTLLSSTDVTCFGGSDGTAEVNVTSGNAPYTFQWQPAGGVNPLATGLTVGNFVITVTDVNGCISTLSANIGEPAAIVLQTAFSQATCGNPNGTASVVAGGGVVFPATYLWSNGSITSNANGLLTGNYSVTVTDANGCTAAAAVNVPGSPVPILNMAATPVSCNGLSDGTASVQVNGGIPPYTYQWNTGAVNSQAGNLPAGTYTVTVTDATGCSRIGTVNVGSPANLNLNVVANPAVCGSANGSIQTNATGGAGGLNYNWSTGQNTANLNNLSAGTYTLTVTDANGCTRAATAVVANQGGPVLTQQALNNVTCFGGTNGSATVTAAGQNAPFTYQWLPTGGSGSTASNLPAGNYTVNVTDANGCISTLNIVINQPLRINLQTTPLAASCGNANGSVSVAITSGGMAPFNYQWSNGQAGANNTALLPGSYTVSVTDATGCTASASAVVGNNGGPAIVLANNTGVSCNGGSNGSATVGIVSGAGPYSYSWQPIGGTSATATGLPAGNYTVAVTDNNGCSSQIPVLINSPAPIALQFNTVPTPCNAAIGSATVQVSGGTGGFSYVWSTGQTTSTITSLTSGSYTVTVTDANGCTRDGNAVVPNTSGPTITSVAVTDIDCYGNANGAASVQYSNGAPPVSILWSNGATGTTINNLSPGNYTVTVTDATGCTDNSSVTVNEPAVLGAGIQVINMVSCAGRSDASAAVSVTGGTGPYIYQWSNGSNTATGSGLAAGNYTVTVTDQNGCTNQQPVTITSPDTLNLVQQQVTPVSCFGGSDGTISFFVTGGTPPVQYLWSNGALTPAISGVTAGNYSIIATDANGCTATGAVQVSEPPVLLISTLSIDSVSCFTGADGGIHVAVTGGVPAYSYLWSNGTTTVPATGLGAATYSLTVTDANGCPATGTFTVSEPLPLGIQGQVADVTCFGMSNGQLNVMASGGIPPYGYNWNNGATLPTITGLSAGNYQVVVNDNNGCTLTASYTVTTPSPLQVTASLPDTICQGQTTSITAVAGGGTPGYTYLWNTGLATPAIQVSPSTTAVYALTVTDSNGCTETLTGLEVAVHPPLSVSLAVSDDTLCFGESTVLFAAAAGGNGGPYNFIWNPALGPGANIGLTPPATTTYTVSVSDGCTSLEPSALQLVVVHPLPPVNFDPQFREGCNPLLVNFNYTPVALPGAVYTWSFGDNTTGSGTNPSHLYTADGLFDVTLTVTSAEGCTNSLDRQNTVRVWPLPVAFFTADPQQASIFNPEIRFINGSSEAETTIWSFGDGSPVNNEWSPSHIYQDTGTYEVGLIVITNKGCVDTFYNEVRIFSESAFYIPNTFTPNGDGDNEFFTGYGIGIRSAEFFIYDRWGEMIFRTDDLSRGWDGNYISTGIPCTQDVYVYLFKVDLGEPEPREYTGKVRLIR